MIYYFTGTMEPRKFDSEDEIASKLPRKLYRKLMPFQKEGVRFAIRKNGRCLIADEMGLGKTLQAISVAYYYKNEWPVLIIVPSSLKFCWIEELEKWLPDILPHQINLVQCGTDASGIAKSLITIVTYGLLRQPTSKVLRETIEACKFRIVICDESHYLKNIKSLSCKIIVPLIKSAERRILLSGTPALAKPAELYSQIDAICPNKFGTFWKFADNYCDAKTVYFGKFRQRKVDGASNLEGLQKKLTELLMIRREKSQVLTELPPKQRQRILFELKDSTLKKELIDKFAELRKHIYKGKKEIGSIFQTELQTSLTEVEASEGDNSKEQQSINSQISHLYKLSGDAKIGPVREYIEMLCDNEKLKFLIFAYHHDMMNGIEQALWDKNIKFVRIDGHTKPGDRQQLVTQFQSDSEIRVAILSILAAGVGLTFTAAKLVVFAELYWTPGVLMQCEDRAHRIGQTSSLAVHYLVAKGTMDEWVWAAVCKKTVVTSTALSGQSKTLQLFEGDKYQIDLLSNADMWRPETDGGQVNVADLVNSTRPSDQSSILEYYTPVKNDSKLEPVNKKRRVENDGMGKGYALKKLTKDNKSVTKEHNSHELVVIRDDDDDFTSQGNLKNVSVKKNLTKTLKPSQNKKNSKKCFFNKQDNTNSAASPTRQNKGIAKLNIESGEMEVTFNAFQVQNQSTPKIARTKLPIFHQPNLFDNGEIQDDLSKKWTCHLCTFDNQIARDMCEMCEMPKTAKKLKSFGEMNVSSQHPENSHVFNFDNDMKLSNTADHLPSTSLNLEVDCNNCFIKKEEPTLKTGRQSDDLTLNGENISRCLVSEAEGNNYNNLSSSQTQHDSNEEVKHQLDGQSICPSEAPKDTHKCLMFSCSVYTGRIYIYNQEGHSLEASFHPIDIEMGNLSELADFLQLPPNLRLLQKFAREWASLSDTKKRLIAKRGLKFISPLAAYSEVKTVPGNKQRHLTKEDIMATAVMKAEAVRGSIRFISKHSLMVSDDQSGLPQTVTEEGVPICLQCQKPYSNPLLVSETVSDPKNAWQLRLCSYACMDKYWILTKVSYCRDQIYEIEQGICKLCQFDADKFYNRIKITKDKKMRIDIINQSPYSGFTARQRQKMVEQPQAGQFWQVDHITPVWQGGGMCDLDNLRTLCTPCHQKITKRQAGERANIKKLSGACQSRDITSFFHKL